MAETESFGLRKSREFGDLIGDTFEFLRMYFKPLMRSLAIIAGPFILLFAIYSSVVTVNLMEFRFNESWTPTFLLNYIFMMVLMVATIVVLAAVSLVFVKMIETGQQVDEIKPERVWKEVKVNLGTLTLLHISLIVILGVFSAVAFIVVIWLQNFVSALIVLAWFCLLIYGSIRLSLSYNAAVMDAHGVLGSISYSWNLMLGAFWQTFFLQFILILVYGFVLAIFSVPKGILQMIMSLHFREAGMPLVWKSVLIGLSIITNAVGILFYAIFFVGQSMQYYNLQERKESRGLYERINSIGETPDEQIKGLDEEVY